MRGPITPASQNMEPAEHGPDIVEDTAGDEKEYGPNQQMDDYGDDNA